MTVDILCRVVDNLGDIGFVYRLARALSALPERPRLRLVIDDLGAFAGICPGVDSRAGYQAVGEWEVTRWDDPGAGALARYREERPRAVLECYACGRPDWFERLLFDETDPEPRLLVDLEYLTAEPWSADYHLLPSLTRSPLVKKAVFMPGFRPGTGGLVQDPDFLATLASASSGEGRDTLRREVLEACAALSAAGDPGGPGSAGTGLIGLGSAIPGASAESILSDFPGRGGDGFGDAPPESAFWVHVFSYEHDFGPLVSDLAEFARGRPLLVLAAAGRSLGPFLSAWERSGRPFPVFALPMLPQTLWDRLLACSDFAVVRGEESLARAVLAGKPFLWECYPFTSPDGEGAGHLDKVYALLDLYRPLFSPEDFARWERLMLRFNGVAVPAAGTPAGRVEPFPGDLLGVLRPAEGRTGQAAGDSGEGMATFAAGFAEFAQKTRELGNLAANLMTFIADLG